MASNKFARVSVFLSQTCLQKLRVHKVVCTGKELLFTKTKMSQRINFLPLCDFFSYFTNIDYRSRTVALKPARLLATFASRSIFSNNFFFLIPNFYLRMLFWVLNKNPQLNQLIKVFKNLAILGMVSYGRLVLSRYL